MGKRRISICKQGMIEMTWSGRQYYLVTFIVAELFSSLILGLDWLRENCIIIDCEKNLVYQRDEEKKIEEIDKEVGSGEAKVMVIERDQEINPTYLSKMVEMQRSDDMWGTIMRNIEEQGDSGEDKKKYCIHKGLLFLNKPNRRNKWVLCVPRKVTRRILKKFHEDSLHPGITKMRRMISNLMIWKGMYKEIACYIRSCHVCQLNKVKPYSCSGPLQAIIPRDVRELVAINLFGPLIKSTFGYMYILVLLDVFSKVIKLYALKKDTSTTCLKKIRNYIQDYGKPRTILSDNGSQITSGKWKQKLYELGIEEKHTAVRYPQGNPCERYIKIVGECLRILVKNRN